MKSLLVLTVALLLASLADAQFLDTDYSSWLPESPDPFLRDLKNKDLKFYHHEPAYQLSDHKGFRLIRTSHPLLGNQDFSGNPNYEFPWRHTAGLVTSSNWRTVTFIHLPGPIKYRFDGAAKAPYSWTYPKGTITGELMFVSDKQGDWHLFEVRTRERKDDGWLSRQFVPITEYKTLGTVTKRIVGFRVDEIVKLGVLGEEDASQLDGVEFIEGGHNYTTDAFSFVPKGYLGSITRCVTCHKQTGMTAEQIGKEMRSRRKWDGVVRGSDEVLSFSILDPRGIGDNVIYQLPNQQLLPITVDQRLIDMGLLVREETR